MMLKWLNSGAEYNVAGGANQAARVLDGECHFEPTRRARADGLVDRLQRLEYEQGHSCQNCSRDCQCFAEPISGAAGRCHFV